MSGDFGWFEFSIRGAHIRQFLDDDYIRDLSLRLVNYTGDIELETESADLCTLRSGGVEFDDDYPKIFAELYQRCADNGLKITGGGYVEDNGVGDRYRFSFTPKGILEFASIQWMLEYPTAEEVRELERYFRNMGPA